MGLEEDLETGLEGGDVDCGNIGTIESMCIATVESPDYVWIYVPRYGRRHVACAPSANTAVAVGKIGIAVIQS